MEADMAEIVVRDARARHASEKPGDFAAGE
ncbi:unnamed protein product [Spirodela intermedia]|uniref:Uncharacterized protein n=1 Tax=Spirodela intermedia TaxID=51605 RepID=A0A7I8LDB2_SPIIN|nr:unnamed protein product [Spirodela intermedia]